MKMLQLFNKTNVQKLKNPLRISTIGDSLTDSGHRGEIMCAGKKRDDWYQYYLYHYLVTRNIPCSIQNYGISGQITEQICTRFKDTIPSDYLVSMAGTNDVWRANYAEPNIYRTLADRIIGFYKSVIVPTIELQANMGHPGLNIVICSIPPVGKVSSLPEKMAGAIEFVNNELKTYVFGLKRTDVIFCDVNLGMRNTSKYMIDGLAVPDGVHFEKFGKKVCGETIGQVIFSKYYT